MAKPPIVSWVEDNWPEAECTIYGGLTGAAVSAAAVSAYTGQVWGVVGAGFVAGGAQLAADLAGCNKSPNIPNIPPGSEGNCWKGEGDGTIEYWNQKNGSWSKLVGYNATEITSVVQGPYVAGFKSWEFTLNFTRDNGTASESLLFSDGGNPAQVRVTGRICDDEPLPDPPEFPEPIGEPFDPPVGDDCNWSCQAVDAYIDGSGKLRVYTVCSSNNPEVCGGPVGFWTGGPDGPEFINPDAPDTVDDDDKPTPAPPPKPPSDPPCCKPPSVSIPGTTYQLRGVCEELPDGTTDQPVVERQIPTLTDLQAVSARIDALIPLLQGQKDFKQPTCPPVKAQGELRTIGFISENYSPNGRNHLRKRVRYRSLSGIGLNALIDHWKDFQFDAGPVIVKHLGSSWGTVTVWAASADEGKRVIRHAAGEAGIDADSTGRWEISGSTSTRLGMPGKMKVNTSGGYFWITARDGASARPLVGTT